ncbi:MAG: hypothetical protein ACFHX7_24485 [Pseudomonadota bacterium]
MADPAATGKQDRQVLISKLAQENLRLAVYSSTPVVVLVAMVDLEKVAERGRMRVVTVMGVAQEVKAVTAVMAVTAERLEKFR